jgi:AGZA family xanthine/uracil permease-like MFS transporter
MFFISMFFAPIFASIPSWATGGALVIVGCLMMRKCVSNPRLIFIVVVLTGYFFSSVLEINWFYIGDAVPAFITLIIIPLTYKYVISSLQTPGHPILSSNPHIHSLAYGVIAGVISYMLLNGIPLALKKISDGRIVPHDFENAEKWVIPPGGLTPPWMCVSLFPDIKYA